MSFRFEITEAFPSRRPIVCLVGWLREGNIAMFERIVVPYTDGTTVLCAIVGIEVYRNRADYLSSEGLEEQVGIAITGLNSLVVRKDSIAIGSVATNEEPPP